MKVLYLIPLLFFSFFSLQAQDSSRTWRLSAGLDIGMISTYQITGIDTGFTNALSLGPSVSLSHKNISFGYSPKFVTGGAASGLYMHALSAGVSEYDKPNYSYAATYSHYFFTGNKTVPYSPMTNEIYTSFTYKKPWLRPGITAGIGFGINTAESPSASVYDIGASAGVSHAFDWESGSLSFSVTPSVYVSAGTNDYFSLLKTTKYIGTSGKTGSYIKKGAGSKNKGRGNSGSTTTTTTVTQGKTFELTNIDLGAESSLEAGSFTIRLETNLYIPIGNAAGSGLSTYWQMVLTYKF
jgi:hypothetical protein